MFDKYHGILHIEDILKREYRYEFNGDLQDLYEKSFVELEGDGVTAYFGFASKMKIIYLNH